MEYKFNVLNKTKSEAITVELPDFECKDITPYIGIDIDSRYPFYKQQIIACVEALQATQVLLVGDDFDKLRSGKSDKEVYKISADFVELIKSSDTLIAKAYLAASYDANAGGNPDVTVPPSTRMVFTHLDEILRLYIEKGHTIDHKLFILEATLELSI